MKYFHLIAILFLSILITACGNLSTTGDGKGNPVNQGNPVLGGETAQVIKVIDGDTIDVRINGREMRVRYIGVNTPERDEVCYKDATEANKRWVSGQTVQLIKDTSETDPFGRLLRYVYVGDKMVNQELVIEGYAEVVLYPPDDQYFETFKSLEIQSTQANRGCHPTGIFADGTYKR